MATYITTLKDATNTNGLLPKTVLKAVADDNGDYLDSNLTVSDINALKGGAFSSSVRHADEVPGTPVQLNADQLNGHADSYFATESEVSKVRGNTQNYNPSSEYDTGDFAVKEGVLYRCLEDNVTGVFDNTKWEVVDLTTLKDEVETNASAILSLSDYSETEVACGKWVDGKTMYKCTLHDTISSQSGGTMSYSSLGSINLIKYEAIVFDNLGICWMANMYGDSGAKLYTYASAGTLVLSTGTTYPNAPFTVYATFFYTKN